VKLDLSSGVVNQAATTNNNTLSRITNIHTITSTTCPISVFHSSCFLTFISERRYASSKFFAGRPFTHPLFHSRSPVNKAFRLPAASTPHSLQRRSHLFGIDLQCLHCTQHALFCACQLLASLSGHLFTFLPADLVHLA
jgi:hypothetical protein